MWTVTLLLQPAIVAAHLLGGMATLALLLWLFFLARLAPERAGSARAAPAGPRGAAGGRGADCARRLGQRQLRGARLPRSAALPRRGAAADGLRTTPSTCFASSVRPAAASACRREALTAIHWTHRAVRAGRRRCRSAGPRFKAFPVMRTLGDRHRSCCWRCSSRSASPMSRSACRSRSPPRTTPARRFCSLRSSC